MEVSTTTNILNAGFSRNNTASDLLNTDTFGIGNALRVSTINDSPVGTARNTALNNSIQQDNNPNPSLNAFGIGSANSPEVEFSPQARILQQNDANQRALAEGLQEIRENVQEQQEESSTLQAPVEAPVTGSLQTETQVPEVQVAKVSAPQVETSSTTITSLQAQRATSLYTSIQNFT